MAWPVWARGKSFTRLDPGSGEGKGGWKLAHKGPFVETPIASLTGGDIFAEGKKVEAPTAIRARARAEAKAAAAAKRLREERKRREVAERHAAARPPSPKNDDMAELDGFLEDDGATAKPSPPRAAPPASPKQVVAVPMKTFDPFAM